MSKYEPLPQFLNSVGGAMHRMSFFEIERILRFKLPKSAYEYEAWWSNNPTGHSHSRAWIEAGWRTESVDLVSRKVTFLRSGQTDATPPSTRPDPWGCMAGTVTIMPGVDLTAVGDDVWNAEQGRLLNE
jgi:hypothetical protein